MWAESSGMLTLIFKWDVNQKISMNIHVNTLVVTETERSEPQLIRFSSNRRSIGMSQHQIINYASVFGVVFIIVTIVGLIILINNRHNTPYDNMSNLTHKNKRTLKHNKQKEKKSADGEKKLNA
ncbi:hypothetical protein HELRODRAFT_175196 [Helobdella robusta]|uniref:Uncharacterized protein n=1 Tax=Helobdella robusta TaxID=6412 RepID=T1F8Z7_HELRO|nr:hypothetical protein HELRODRAFT_175196 [Helobdella robusta]ESO01167.1 hypothetical protein HELRODRAFT_175196 [Helobdella robusta]